MLQETKQNNTVLLERVVALFGDQGVKRTEYIRGAILMDAHFGYQEFTDEMLRSYFNDVVYDRKIDNLYTKYVVPPFSILDTRSGNWQERRRAWLELAGNLTATKENVLSQGENLISTINGGSSNFDPVLAELMFKWFNISNGKILDPFGGEQTKGVVAGYLKMPYWGCELRQDQVDYNIQITMDLPAVNYSCGDSRHIASIIGERNFDMVLTSPPYYDLEVYSDQKDDISTFGTFDDFMKSMQEIYAACISMLNDNRFFVVKIGEIRDRKTGVYRNFVGETIQVLKKLGLEYYNELILLNSPGTAPMRATSFFTSRKMVKVHQNVLVFFKGDVRQIPKLFTRMSDFNPLPVLDQGSLFQLYEK